MKHIKLFEAFGDMEQAPHNFSPEDISLSGDTVFCWNFEDGWMVTLLDKQSSPMMFQYLEENKSRLVTDIKYSNKEGIAFVTTGIPTDLDVQFEDANFIPSSVDYFINSEGAKEILEFEFENSCAFTLKRNHVIGYMWNDYDFCLPIQDYLEEY